MDRILSRFQPVSPRQLLHSDYLSHVDLLYTVQRYWDLHSVHFHPEHWSSQWNDWICVEQHCLFSTFHSCTSLSLEPGNMGTRIYCFRWKRYLLSECSWQSHENYRFRILFWSDWCLQFYDERWFQFFFHRRAYRSKMILIRRFHIFGCYQTINIGLVSRFGRRMMLSYCGIGRIDMLRSVSAWMLRKRCFI